jgi:integrase
LKKADAEKLRRDLEERLCSGGAGGLLSPSEVADLNKARGILNGDANLAEAAAYWRKHHPEIPGIKLRDAVIRYLDDMESILAEETTLPVRKGRLEKFADSFGDVLLESVTTEEIEIYVQSSSNNLTTRNSELTAIRAFFKWCASRRVRLISDNPAMVIEKEPEEYASPEFLAVEDVEALLLTAENHDPRLLPFLVLGFFAGMRTCEVERIRPTDLHYVDSAINLRGEVAKRKRKGKTFPRLLENLPEAIWHWLRPHLDPQGYVKLDTRNAAVRRKALCRKAGIDWIHSGARHTFSTYAVALTQDPGKVAKWTGHRILATLLDHYVGLAPQAQGIAFFELRPTKAEYPLVTTADQAKQVDWPDDETLSRMVWEMPTTEVAFKIGVSDKAVWKRCKKRGIAKPPRGYWAKRKGG